MPRLDLLFRGNGMTCLLGLITGAASQDLILSLLQRDPTKRLGAGAPGSSTCFARLKVGDTTLMLACEGVCVCGEGGGLSCWLFSLLVPQNHRFLRHVPTSPPHIPPQLGLKHRHNATVMDVTTKLRSWAAYIAAHSSPRRRVRPQGGRKGDTKTGAPSARCALQALLSLWCGDLRSYCCVRGLIPSASWCFLLSAWFSQSSHGPHVVRVVLSWPRR